nr:MAG TPA: hypothetical protein [Caudoviricetes sp.]
MECARSRNPDRKANNTVMMWSSIWMELLYTSQTTKEKMDKEKIIGFEALYKSMKKCAKGVLWKDSVAFFYHNWVREILRLEKELKTGTYKERKPKFFTVTEPKTREIMSIAFRDRVYQRSLNDVALYPILTKSCIYDNHACQVGKGTDKARARFKCFLQRHYRKHGAKGAILKCDIKGYYPNMDRAIVKEKLKVLLDPEVYKMTADILDTFPNEVGFNPGSQIIQIIGISILNPLDHYIKEKLRIKGYTRYMDDFLLIHEDAEYLQECIEKIKLLLIEFHMELNTEKTGIFSLTEGVKFLGFYYKLTETGKVIITMDPKKVKHERRKLRRMAELVKKGLKTRKSVDRHYESWKVHASFGNSFKMLQNMDKFYKNLWREENGV